MQKREQRSLSIPIDFAGSLIAGLTAFVVFLPALDNGFVRWDDFGYVVNNIHIRTISLSSIKWMLFEPYLSNWHPLTWLSLAVDYAFWGPNPFGFHLTNVTLHALNTVLVVILTKRLLIPAGCDPRLAMAAAFLCGLVFGLHPIHVESVAWVSERKDVLYAFFYLWSIILYLKYRVTGRRAHYNLCFLMFLLSALSKPMAISLPLVLLTLDYYPLGTLQFNRPSLLMHLRDKWPMILLAAALGLVTLIAQSESEAMESMKVIALSERLLLAQRAPIFYLYKFFVPVGYIYLYPIPSDISWLQPTFFLPLTANLAIAAAAFICRKKVPLITASALVYLWTLLPVIGIVQVGAQAAADRYMYLAMLVPAMLVSATVMRLYEAGFTSKRGRTLSLAILSVVTITLAMLTEKQIPIWKDTVALTSHAIKYAPLNNHAYTLRAEAYFNDGEYSKSIADIDKAMKISSDHPYRAIGTVDHYFALRGKAHIELAMFPQAVADLSAAIARNPTESSYFINRAVAYTATRQIRLAHADLLRALELTPDDSKVNNNAAQIEYELGKYEEAVKHLSAAIGHEPGNGILYYNRALNYYRLNKREKMHHDLVQAARLGVARAKEILDAQGARHRTSEDGASN